MSSSSPPLLLSIYVAQRSPPSHSPVARTLFVVCFFPPRLIPRFVIDWFFFFHVSPLRRVCLLRSLSAAALTAVWRPRLFCVNLCLIYGATKGEGKSKGSQGASAGVYVTHAMSSLERRGASDSDHCGLRVIRSLGTPRRRAVKYNVPCVCHTKKKGKSSHHLKP